MTTDRWTFHVGPEGLDFGAPDGIGKPAQIALRNFANSDIGNSMWMWSEYRKIWSSLPSDPAAAREGISGNATSQRIEGDDVVLEALYDQWPAARISKAQFETFLDQFGEFLRYSSSGS